MNLQNIPLKNDEDFTCYKKMGKCKINKASTFDGILNGTDGVSSIFCIRLSKSCFSSNTDGRDFRSLCKIHNVL